MYYLLLFIACLLCYFSIYLARSLKFIRLSNVFIKTNLNFRIQFEKLCFWNRWIGRSKFEGNIIFVVWTMNTNKIISFVRLIYAWWRFSSGQLCTRLLKVVIQLWTVVYTRHKTCIYSLHYSVLYAFVILSGLLTKTV